MEEENLQDNMEEAGFPQEPPEELSSTDAMVGVFTEPGETFESISYTTKKNYWLIPTLVFMVISLISIYIVSLDPELMQAELNKQMDKSKEIIEKQISEGKISREDADKSLELQKTFAKIFVYIGGVLGGFLVVFVLGLLYFIGFKVFKSSAGYMDAVNIVGLALTISSLQVLVGALLSVLTGKLSSLGLSLILSEENVGLGLYTFLAQIDVFSIWFYIVISIGLIKIGKLRPIQGYGMVFGLWIIWTILTSFISAAFV